jgi:predicted P-loop ATPase
MPIPKITHDGPLDIATGRHRRESNWKNKQTLWSALLEKLSTTHRTAESYAEYLAAKKPRQDEIKDIGGFVGGYLDKGKRRKNSILNRQLITLDADSPSQDLWPDFKMFYDNAACIYSTHKHSPELPRYRLILPLDREVMPDEYIAIARRLAGSIGIEYFDPTTYQPERLMYWPSTSKDGTYVFEAQDGPWISADAILATYHDWRDSSEWPMSDRERSIPLRAIKKQGDPLEKPGIIGAFCRTYNIHEAIAEFLPDVYEPCDVNDRYTYAMGSTAGGLVVYDDKYAYSHHGTDPVSGKLCNAFDLVRLHKFGLQDEDVREGAKATELPSYKEMIVFACKDPATSKTLSMDKLEETEADFADDLVDAPQAEENLDWLSDIKKDKQGRATQTIENVIIVLNNDTALKGKFAYNEFEGREVATGRLPWRHDKNTSPHLTDTDDAGLRHYLEKRYDLSSANKIKDALDIVIKKNSFHPVREYLSALQWDGEERLETLLIDYLGAEDNIYVRTVTRKALVAAVARIFQPGIKFDNMLTIVGDQGIGKSTILSKLGGKWFSDSFNFHMLSSKQGEEQLRGAWLVEVGELTGLSKTDVESAKSFLSRCEDRYRVAYGKRLEYFPRQNIFFGSTNNKRPLRDSSGGRRFWIVVTDADKATKSVFDGLTQDDVDQIWAEAYTYYESGESLVLSAEVKTMAEAMQQEHTEADDQAGVIADYLEILLPERWESMDVWQRRDWLKGEDELSEAGTIERTHVSVAEIWCELMGGTIKDMTKNNTKHIHDYMQQRSGWKMGKKTKRYKLYGTQRVYEKRVNEVQKIVNKRKRELQH